MAPTYTKLQSKAYVFHFGKRVLFSTDTLMNPEDIIKIYNIDKPEVEDAFKK